MSSCLRTSSLSRRSWVSEETEEELVDWESAREGEAKRARRERATIVFFSIDKT